MPSPIEIEAAAVADAERMAIQLLREAAPKLFGEVAGRATLEAAELGGTFLKSGTVGSGALWNSLAELRASAGARVQPFDLVAHRARLFVDGAVPGVAPGNTVEAFQQYLSEVPAGVVPRIETDVRLLKNSNVLAVWHDNVGNYATNIGSIAPNRPGWFNHLSLSEFDALRIRMGGQVTNYRIPKLEDILRVMNGKGILELELKNGLGDGIGVLDRTLETLKRFPNQEVAFSSFDHRLLAQVPGSFKVGVLSNTMPAAPTYEQWVTPFLKGGRQLENVAWHPDFWNISEDFLRTVPKEVPINTYMVPKEYLADAWRRGFTPITDDSLVAHKMQSALKKALSGGVH